MSNKTEIGLLLARVVLGAIMLTHGIDKFMNMDMVVGMFTDMFELPAFLAYVTAIIEVVAGISLILGLFVEISAALLGLVMMGAMVTVKFQLGFFGNGQMAGWELDLALLGLAFVLTFGGSRLFALSSIIGKDSSAVDHRVA
ncbi:DoxX family protein [Bacillus sp. 2205SS5-2]|uniref:DoxX family protein n=1 Tax=Bacillus sp. 2205SS5-2 TaxID=3109031 RepID=UPI003006377B